MELSPIAQVVCVAQGSKLVFIDLEEKNTLGTVSLSGGARSVRYAPDGESLVVASN